MPECFSSPQEDSIRETSCIHTRKIYDSCQAKDCMEDLRLYPVVSAQSAIDSALSLKSGRAELLYIYMNVEPVGLGQGFYSIDMRFYYRVTMDAASGCSRSVPISGLAVYSKRCVLFGSEGQTQTFSSEDSCAQLEAAALDSDAGPIACCEAANPIILSLKLAEHCGRSAPGCEAAAPDVPTAISAAFDEKLSFADNTARRVYVTLGQFSILRLERDAHIMVPVCGCCFPSKECTCSDGDTDPCEVFQQVSFPVSDFCPPSTADDIDPSARFRCGGCASPRG